MSIKLKRLPQPTIKMKALPMFPANVVGTNGINVAKSGSTYTFSIESGTFPSFALASPLSAGDIFFAAGPGAIDALSSVAAGKALLSGLLAPSWGEVPVTGGGTGAASFTTNGVLVGNGTGAVGATAAGTQGALLSGVASANPIFVRGVVNLKSYPGVGLGNASVDNAALQAAIDDATIGTIYLPKGDYVLNTTGITLQSNKKLVGDGMGLTVVKVAAAPAAGTDPIFANGKSNLVFQDITFDYNGFGTVMDGQFPGLRAFIYLIGGSRIAFLRCGFKGFYNAGLMTNTANTVTVKDCIIELAATSNGPTSAGNYGISIAGTATIDASNAYDCLIDGNIVINTSIGVSVRDSTISNNIVHGAGFGAGIHTQSLASNFNNRIIGNTVFDSGTAQDLAGAYPGGIEIWGHSSVIANNVCYRNGACGINAGASKSVYANNVCYNNGLSLIAGSAGIAAFAQDATFNAGNSLFVGNKCYDDQATKTQEYGYLEHPNLITYGVTNITLGVNEFTGNELGDVLLQAVTRGGHLAGQYKLTGGFTGGTHTAITSLSVVNGGFHQFIASAGSQSANRTLSFNLNDGDRTISLANSLTLGGAFQTSGGHSLILTTTNATNVTLPTTGTLATLAGTEALTNKTLNGVTLDNNAWTNTTPTVTAASGTFTTVSCQMYHKEIGKMVHWYAAITVTTVGTAAARVIMPLPVNTARTGACVVSGMNNTTTKGLTGINGYDTAHSVSIFYAADGTFPVTSGQTLFISGFYERS